MPALRRVADHRATRCTTRARASACCRRASSVSLTTLLYGLLLPSGNDAAIALADYVAGTQSRFVALMNQRAHATRVALHPLHERLGHRRPGQLLVRAGPRPDRPPAARATAAGADRRLAQRDPAASRSRAGSCTSTTTTRCCVLRYAGNRRRQDGVHRRRRPVPGRHRTARETVAGRRAAPFRRHLDRRRSDYSTPASQSLHKADRGRRSLSDGARLARTRAACRCVNAAAHGYFQTGLRAQPRQRRKADVPRQLPDDQAQQRQARAAPRTVRA